MMSKLLARTCTLTYSMTAVIFYMFTESACAHLNTPKPAMRSLQAARATGYCDWLPYLSPCVRVTHRLPLFVRSSRATLSSPSRKYHCWSRRTRLWPAPQQQQVPFERWESQINDKLGANGLTIYGATIGRSVRRVATTASPNHRELFIFTWLNVPENDVHRWRKVDPIVRHAHVLTQRQIQRC